MTEQPTVRVDVETQPGCDVVTVVGTLDLTTVSALREVVFDPTRCVQPLLVIDLNGVEFLDSQGIASLVAARRRAAGRDAELVLVAAQPHLRKLFRISRLDTVLRVVDSVPEARRDDEIA
jgi:anti-sigma B factor antagonist